MFLCVCVLLLCGICLVILVGRLGGTLSIYFFSFLKFIRYPVQCGGGAVGAARDGVTVRTTGEVGM